LGFYYPFNKKDEFFFEKFRKSTSEEKALLFKVTLQRRHLLVLGGRTKSKI
jgi:hypothetical protein